MAIKLKLELKWTKIKRVVTIPSGLNLMDLSDIIQAMFGFEHDHLWNFRNKAGKVWDTGCDPFGGALNMDMRGILDPGEFCIEDVLVDSKEKLLYSYDYGDGWEIVVSRMADSKDDEIACVETAGTNAMEDIGGVGGVAVYGDGEWKTYGPWEKYEIIHTGDDYLEFELVYPACCALGKMTYHITMRKGDDFFRNDVSFECPGAMGKDWIVRPEIKEDPNCRAKPFLRFTGDGTKPCFSYEAGFTVQK